MTLHKGHCKETTAMTPTRPPPDTRRRQLLGSSVAGAASLALPGLGFAQSKPIKIGFITGLSGVRANFGETDRWQLEKILAIAKKGITVAGKTHAVEILLKDNQSDPGRSQQVSSELILRDKVDLLLVQDFDAALPAGQLADVHGIPMISTQTPWQAFTFGRGSTPEKGFPFSFHFFWGADDTSKNFLGIWDQLKTNKAVGSLYIDNPPGRAFGDPKMGLPPAIAASGYKEIPGGFFKVATNDFSNQVTAFKSGGAQIATGFMFANHFATFWKQTQQAGLKPEAVTMAAAFLFPSAVNSLGEAGDGMTTEVWWTPSFPFKSSLTGQSAAEMAAEWERATGKQWTQPIGYGHAIWELGLHALSSAADPRDHKAVRDAIANLTLDTLVGKVDFKGSPIKNVAQTALLGGQWRRSKGGKFPYELKIVHNSTAKVVPVEAEVVPLSALK